MKTLKLDVVLEEMRNMRRALEENTQEMRDLKRSIPTIARFESLKEAKAIQRSILEQNQEAYKKVVIPSVRSKKRVG